MDQLIAKLYWKGQYRSFKFLTVGMTDYLKNWIRSGGDVVIKETLYNCPNTIERLRSLESNVGIITERV